jgi:FkbM family methyltransferase
MKKILFIAPHLSTGGLPQVLVNKLELLKDEYKIYCVEWSWHGDAFVVQKNRIRNLIGSENLFMLGEDKTQIFNLIEQLNPDIICLEEFCEHFIPEEINQKLFNKDRSYKIFETTHDSSIPVTNKRWFPDKFIFVSPFNAFRYSMFDVPYEIIEYPIDIIKPNKEWAQKELMLDPEYKHIVIVGLFTERKNQGYAFEMAKLVKDQKILFHFIGNQADNFRHYWEPLMKDKPDNCVVWGERSDVDTFLQASDLFLFPSRGDRNNKELNPIAIKEAIKYKLPMMMYNLDVYCGKYNDSPKVKFMSGNLKEDTKILLNTLGMTNISNLLEVSFSPEENKIILDYHYNETHNVNIVIKCMSSNAPMYWCNVQFTRPMSYFIVPIPPHVMKFSGMKNFRGFNVEFYDPNTNELIGNREIVVNNVLPSIPRFDFKPFDCNYVNYHEFFIDKCFSGLGLENLDTVIDIGANVGLFAKYMYSINSKKVILVEANPYLKDSIETLLGDDLERSTIYMNPIYKEHTKIPFRFSMENTTIGSNYFGTEDPNYGQLSNVIECETITLDDILKNNNYERISLLKCDIEGGEYPFFESVTDEQINLVDRFMVEFHGNRNNEIQPILEKLVRNNYQYEIVVFELGRQIRSNESVEHGVIFAKPKLESTIEDYSQNGEQKIILDFFQNEDNRKNKFLDIGANDGISFSNTHALSLLGWEGVCVEPTQTAFMNLQNLYRNNKRIKCINAGISDKTEIVKIHESLDWVSSKAPQGILSTLHSENKTRFTGMNWEESKIILYTYKDLEEFYNLENDVYDFINLDVEGHELIVLDQIKDILSKCRLICVEKTEDTNRNEILEKKLNEYGFSVINITIDNFLAKNDRYS